MGRSSVGKPKARPCFKTSPIWSRVSAQITPERWVLMGLPLSSFNAGIWSFRAFFVTSEGVIRSVETWRASSPASSIPFRSLGFRRRAFVDMLTVSPFPFA
ncbi:MAG: hypothetical protein BWY86_00496 [Candidatus Aminicenantes bacterium ADurb.Bin508]|nr:MAG: hypothetical protein BWY86_00496 [Candidatus Aminicenantes bacterium ADurb.Bin508]